MQNEHQIIKMVYAAKEDLQKASDLIQMYIPFILSETSKFLSRTCTDQDDEFSIAMMAFHEAIMGYSKSRGAFLHYTSMLIHNRLIDYQRKESRHRGQVSLDATSGQEGSTLLEELAAEKDYIEESVNRCV